MHHPALEAGPSTCRSAPPTNAATIRCCSFRSAALVCKRFLRLLLAPSLLHDLQFELPGDGSAMLRPVARLIAWLRKHATGTVERLRLDSDLPLSGGGFDPTGVAMASAALEQLLAAVPALNTRVQLVELTVVFCSPVSGQVQPAATADSMPREAGGGQRCPELPSAVQLFMHGCFVRHAHTSSCRPTRLQVAGSAPISRLWALGMQPLRNLNLDYAEWGGDIEVRAACNLQQLSRAADASEVAAATQGRDVKPARPPSCVTG